MHQVTSECSVNLVTISFTAQKSRSQSLECSSVTRVTEALMLLNGALLSDFPTATTSSTFSRHLLGSESYFTSVLVTHARTMESLSCGPYVSA